MRAGTRWSADQVLHLAPDAASQRSARALATTRAWRETGHSAEPPGLWGLCAGSGTEPYQTCVDLSEPGFRCTCPSRKVPCKHALSLMLLWSDSGVESTTQPPEWVSEWLAERHERQARTAARGETRAAGPRQEAESTDAQRKTAERRAARVEGGL